MIEIKADKSIVFDGEKINPTVTNMHDFLIANLSNEVEIDADLKLGDLVHVLYDIKDFISQYFADEYNVASALISMGKLLEGAEKIKFFKTLEITEEKYVDINSQCEIVSSADGQNKIFDIANLTIECNDELQNVDGILTQKVKTSFKLIDVLEILFDDLLYTLKSGNVLA